MTPQEFIAAVSPAAIASFNTTKVPASFVIAEGALESGWGLHAPGNNLFGVKADVAWKGPFTVQKTREFIQGQVVMIEAKFRAYADWLGCLVDHAAYFHANPRYARCFGTTDGKTFCHQVAAAGYATDPDYAQKLCALIDAHNLTQYDQRPLA